MFQNLPLNIADIIITIVLFKGKCSDIQREPEMCQLKIVVRLLSFLCNVKQLCKKQKQFTSNNFQ